MKDEQDIISLKITKAHLLHTEILLLKQQIQGQYQAEFQNYQTLIILKQWSEVSPHFSKLYMIQLDKLLQHYKKRNQKADLLTQTNEQVLEKIMF